jgi:hypothetical protein
VDGSFPHPYRTALGLSVLLYKKRPVSFPEIKYLGCGVYHPPLSRVEVKERVELYLCYPSGLVIE